MSFLLHLETSTEVCAVAVSEGNRLLCECVSDQPNAHTSSLTLLIQACLDKAGLKLSQMAAVSLASGPGSYTSLRAGASTAKGICFALQLPMVAVPSLRSLMAGAAADEYAEDALYLAMIDARRMDVYCAGYHANGDEVLPLHFATIDEAFFQNLKLNYSNIILCGNGAPKCQPFLTNEKTVATIAKAAYLVEPAWEAFSQGKFVDIAYFEPNYFKEPNITTPKKNLI